MTTQHTPGRWSVAKQEYDISGNACIPCYVVQTESIPGHVIARLTIVDSEANARLIACLPDLLEACQILIEIDENYGIYAPRCDDDHGAQGAIDAIRQIIAKATAS